MIFLALPHPIRLLILVVAGTLIGSFINWAIYSWPYFLKRPISPWMTADPKASPRTWSDRIPVFGWLALRRDHSVHGKGFWIRPLLIEVCWAIGLPWFYYWQIGGGLTGGVAALPPLPWSLWTETWFLGHTILIALMFIATFIDFDERTIPDLITIPGTLVALCLAAGCDWFRLPEVVPNMAGATVQLIQFASPDKDLPVWHTGMAGMLAALAVFTIWIFSLLPKICTLRYGVLKGLQYMLASAIRPKRKSACEIRKTDRGPFGISILLALLWLLGIGAILVAKQFLPAANWDSLFGAFFGLGFGGGMVWSIRVVARHAMGKEAMGFGDVTLMAMIGAFLGWQAALLTFAFAPFAALLIVLVSFIITKENELAFGPYLCFGCLMSLLGWHVIWPAAAQSFFFVGPLLFVFLLVALVLMSVMLFGIQWVKGLFLGEEVEA